MSNNPGKKSLRYALGKSWMKYPNTDTSSAQPLRGDHTISKEQPKPKLSSCPRYVLYRSGTYHFLLCLVAITDNLNLWAATRKP